jgi:hypothetical protein
VERASCPSQAMNIKTVDINIGTMSVQELLSLVNEQTEIVLTDGSKPNSRLLTCLSTAKPRTSGLHPDAIATSDDFDEPLSEEFGMGEE